MLERSTDTTGCTPLNFLSFMKTEVHVLTIFIGTIKKTRYNQMIVAIVDVLTSFDVVTNDNR